MCPGNLQVEAELTCMAIRALPFGLTVQRQCIHCTAVCSTVKNNFSRVDFFMTLFSPGRPGFLEPVHAPLVCIKAHGKRMGILVLCYELMWDSSLAPQCCWISTFHS
mmetsp:Transcript_37372/g.61422  ORF Transcript_37372/g.61422 Transcript_37372/m.61422 type:complete len:107 (+) Transcript_37372:913-1233(+)